MPGAGCSSFAQVGTSPTPSFSDSGLHATRRATAIACARPMPRAISVAISNIASATTTPPDTQAPTAPTSLSATPASRRKSISPGRRPRTTSASRTIWSSAAQARLHAPSRRSARRRRRRSATRPRQRRRPIAIASAPPMPRPISSCVLEHRGRDDAGAAGHRRPQAPDRCHRNSDVGDHDRLELDRVDGQRRRDRLCRRALPGRGLHRFAEIGTRRATTGRTSGSALGTTYRYRVRGDRCRDQLQPVFGRGDRDHTADSRRSPSCRAMPPSFAPSSSVTTGAVHGGAVRRERQPRRRRAGTIRPPRFRR